MNSPAPPQAMVVDDSRATRRILGKMLTELGYDVAEAEHGREALEVLAERPATELALVDWNMPEMNGLEFIKAVREQRVWDVVRLIMVTTETEGSQVLKAMYAGADEYVMKPFTGETIVEKLAILGLPRS